MLQWSNPASISIGEDGEDGSCSGNVSNAGDDPGDDDASGDVTVKEEETGDMDEVIDDEEITCL